VPEATRFWHLAFVIWHLAFVRRRSPGDAPTVGNSETRRRRGWRLRWPVAEPASAWPILHRHWTGVR